jgi:hypothetical protein
VSPICHGASHSHTRSTPCRIMACMRAVKEVRVTPFFGLPACEKEGFGGVRERSELPQYQTYKRYVRVLPKTKTPGTRGAGCFRPRGASPLGLRDHTPLSHTALGSVVW